VAVWELTDTVFKEGCIVKRTKALVMVIIPVVVIIAMMLIGCEYFFNGYGYDTNGYLEGTIWEGNNIVITFSKNAIYISRTIDIQFLSIKPGTYRSYLNGDIVNVDADKHHDCSFKIDRFNMSVYNMGWQFICIPAPGFLIINGNLRHLNGFTAMAVDGGLSLIGYNGDQKNLTLPLEIGGVPIVAIGDGTISPFAIENAGRESYLQLTSIVIPDTVTTINPGVFRSRDLFGYSHTLGVYLSEGITIGANVTIMGENAGAGWDQGWGALDPAKKGRGNFIAYESDHTGYWLDIGFVKFYNENGRRAGKYTWTSSYDSDHYQFTFTWLLNEESLLKPYPEYALTAPTGFSVAVTSKDHISASWDQVPNAKGYYLYGFVGRATGTYVTTTETAWSGYYYDTDGNEWKYMQVSAFNDYEEGPLSSYQDTYRY
jgi:hypothetical protein